MLTKTFCRRIAVMMALLASLPVLASEGEAVAAFSNVTISVAGKTQIHPGAEYRVSIKAEASARERIRVEVDGDTLRVYCPSNCGSLHHDGVDIYVPSLSAVHLLNGGRIELDSGLAATKRLELTIHNGGTIQASNVPAQQVAAEVLNGGHIVLTACAQLDARIRNGGDIEYFGTPKLGRDVINGGTVSSKGNATLANCSAIPAEAAH